MNRVAGRRRAAGDARAPVADYTTFDLLLASRRGKSQSNFSASVRNLFNADVREPSLAPGLALAHDLPMAPRAFSLQASYHLWHAGPDSIARRHLDAQKSNTGAA